MSEENLEDLIKTMEVHEKKEKEKAKVTGDMDDFWNDCIELNSNLTKPNATNKKEKNSNKKLNNNLEEDELPEDYITCNTIKILLIFFFKKK